MKKIIFLLFFLTQAQAYGFIGGEPPGNRLNGLVKFINDSNVSSCSGTLISLKHILTASHCLGKTNTAILGDNRLIAGPHLPFNTVLKVLTDNGANKDYEEFSVQVKEIYFYQKKLTQNYEERYPSYSELLAMGDVAIVELASELPARSSFSKLHFNTLKNDDFIWIGGFGKRGVPYDTIDVSLFGYRGSYAKIGSRYDYNSYELKEFKYYNYNVVNIENDVTYIAPGDSGGGVFFEDNGEYKLVGINHASLTRDNSLYREIKVDKDSGKVLTRPKSKYLQSSGIIYYFHPSNRELQDWIELILNKN